MGKGYPGRLRRVGEDGSQMEQDAVTQDTRRRTTPAPTSSSQVFSPGVMNASTPATEMTLLLVEFITHSVFPPPPPECLYSGSSYGMRMDIGHKTNPE